MTEFGHFLLAVLCIILSASGFALHATAFGTVWLILAFLQALSVGLAKANKTQ